MLPLRLPARAALFSLGLLLTAAACDDSTDTPPSDGGVPVLPIPGLDAGLFGSDGGTYVPPLPPILTGDSGVRPPVVVGSDAATDAATPPAGDGGTPPPVTGGSGPYIRGDAPTAATASKAGPYKVSQIAEAAGLRNGPDYAGATLFYPTDATPPFASVAVVPGFVSSEMDIQEWGPFLASHGIVTITIGTNSGFDQPDVRAKALLDALATVRAENTRAASPLMGKLDESRQASMGWSMGGGGTLLAAEQTPTLKATISMCGWNPDNKYSKLKVPALMFAAKGDTLAGGQSQGFYDSIPAGTPKELWESPGEGQLGGHYMYNTPKNQNGLVGKYGLSWLKVFLEGDERYRPLIVEVPGNKTEFKHDGV